MKYVVDAIAEECKFNYACLNDPNFELCEVESCVNRQIYFVKKNDRYCPYRKSFGYSYYCKCPVRKEIYDKYKI